MTGDGRDGGFRDGEEVFLLQCLLGSGVPSVTLEGGRSD